ncbi:MAG: M20/M25/M40 family metallo-hydrolase [Clostridia bacterium]|nr:M20/M25/M40 family metallo-hydrolase [Clostridia bacterium]
MDKIKSDLHRLCVASGAAGLPEIVDVCRDLLADLTDEVEVDAMGNVLAVRRAADPNAPLLMLEAHLDEIGFLVTHIDDKGFVHVAAAGGVDERVLTAQPVIVHGDKPYAGVFCSTPPHLASKDGELPELADRGIDIGMSAEEAKTHIQLGSRVTFAPAVRELNDTMLTGKALDDRAGIAAILHCLRRLDGPQSMHIGVALCVQEELGCRGCVPAVRRLQPKLAIVTDVSFGHTPDADSYACGKMGGGVMVGISPVLHTGMTKRLQTLAESGSIPQQTEVMGGNTGTDADMISRSLLGIPTALLSIPLRYMHTPVETVDVRDVAAVGDLMAAYIREGGAEIE